jgi:hypothetical protein
MGRKLINLIGNTYGYLTVFELVPESSPTKWICKCDCGNVATVLGFLLKNGTTQSCGCYRSEQLKKRMTTHGGSVNEPKIYSVWNSMIQRTTNPKAINYVDYGGRGITVCEEWKEFIPFRDWALSSGYATNLKIERVNGDLGYSPDNCVWETSTAQSRNRRPHKNTASKFMGVSFYKKLQKWQATIGINRKLIHLGYFLTEAEAAEARDKYVHEHKLPNFILNSGEKNTY